MYINGHPKTRIRELLGVGSVNRIIAYAKEHGEVSSDPECLTYGDIHHLDKNELLNRAKGRGISSERLSEFSEALDKCQIWHKKPGSRIPFSEKQNKLYDNRKTPHEMNKALLKDQEECGSYVLLKNKHASALKSILTSSNHPLAKDILAEFKDEIDHICEVTIEQNECFIAWEESAGGYSVAAPSRTYDPEIQVFARWDAVVMNHNITIVQISDNISILGEEMEAYIDLDTNPKHLCSCSVDFSNANRTIIKRLQSRLPANIKYSVSPQNTNLLGHPKVKLLPEPR